MFKRKPREQRKPIQPTENVPLLATALEQNVKPVVSEAQHLAAATSVSGRKAVSRGKIFLVFYFWLLSGAILLSWMARRTQFFPGDRGITRTLQKQQHSWLRRAMHIISEPGFPKYSIPLTAGIAGAFWLLRFRLEALFLLLSSTSNLLNAFIKRIIKRPRPTQEMVRVAR